MAKSERESSQQQATAANGEPCYCEYYCSAEEWWLVGANPPSGYYCPEETDTGCEHGSYSCFPPVPVGSSALVHSHRDCGEFCRYVYQHGQYYLVEGKCGCGNYCPTDLMAYLQAHNPPLHTFLRENPGAVQGLSIHPGHIIKCETECGGGHHSEGNVAKQASTTKKGAKA